MLPCVYIYRLMTQMTVLRNVDRVDGPVTYMDLIDRHGNHILLFGDHHTDRSNGCKNCHHPSCMTITSFLRLLLRSKTYKTDVFVETAPHLSGTGSNHQSAVQRLYRSWANKKVKNCRNRIHWIDIRELHPTNNWIGLYDIHEMNGVVKSAVTQGIHDFLLQHPTMKNWLSYIDVFVLDDHPQTHFPSYLQNSVPLSRKGGLKVHKVRKQVLKLDSPDRHRLIKFYAEMKQDVKRNYEKLFDKLVETELRTFDDFSFRTYQRQQTILIIILTISCLLMDVYGLARMLYYLKLKSNEQHLVAVFAGDDHVEQYRRFFVETLGWQPTVSQPYHGRPLRCVHI